MSDRVHDYEQVSVYGLDAGPREELLRTHAECTFNWSTKDGWPVGVIMSYLWKDGRFWLTAGAHRHRIEAVSRDPRVSIVVSSAGTKLGAGKSITVKGRCSVHENAATKRWFYPEFAHHLYPEPRAAERFARFLDSPLRIVLEVVPEKWITYDGVKMAKHGRGRLDESALAAPSESDTLRLQRELERRGLR